MEISPSLVVSDGPKTVADLSRTIQRAIVDMKKQILKVETQVNKEKSGPPEWTI